MSGQSRRTHDVHAASLIEVALVAFLAFVATPEHKTRMPDHVLTLIAADQARGEIERAAAAIAAALAGAPDWLASGGACDIVFDGEAQAAERAARDIIGGAAIDLVVQRRDGRRKKLLIADMESTVIRNEMLDEMADLVGLRERVADITRHAMNGEIDFVAALKERVALFKGQPESLLATAARRIVYTPGAKALVATMNANGARSILVSGGFRVFVSEVAAALGFTLDRANDLVIEGGVLTGAVREPILAPASKLEILREMAAKFGVAAGESLAVGDGANDLPMLGAAGLGVAFHPKPILRDRIHARIDHADLTALLYVQGYRADEILR
jgi:phosphoserine phosphatase